MTRKKGLKMLNRVVTGNKVYHGIDPTTGVRRKYQPGTAVLVTQAQARAFVHCLVDPKVMAAQAEAAKAAKEAEAAAVSDEAEAEVAAEAKDKGDDSGES